MIANVLPDPHSNECLFSSLASTLYKENKQNRHTIYLGRRSYGLSGQFSRWNEFNVEKSSQYQLINYNFMPTIRFNHILLGKNANTYASFKHSLSSKHVFCVSDLKYISATTGISITFGHLRSRITCFSNPSGSQTSYIAVRWRGKQSCTCTNMSRLSWQWQMRSWTNCSYPLNPFLDTSSAWYCLFSNP